MTRVLSGENGKRGPGDVDEAKEVRLNLITKAPFRHLFDGGAIGIARVVDNDVEGAKSIDGCIDGILRCTRVGDVERKRQDVLTIRLGQIAELLRLSGRCDDAISALECGLGDRPPETPRTSGDQPDLRHANRSLRSFFGLPTPVYRATAATGRDLLPSGERPQCGQSAMTSRDPALRTHSKR